MSTRRLTSCLVAAVVLGVASVSSRERLAEDAEDQTVSELLTLARTAIGGEGKLASVKSLKLVSDSKAWNESFGRHPDAKQEYIDKKVDIYALWPDHFLRIRTTVLPGGRTMPTFRSGFSGASNVGGTEVANQERVAFARWMLLFLLRTDTSVPLTLRPNLNQYGELQFDGPLRLYCAIKLDPTTRAPLSLRTPVMRPQADGLPGTETLREIIMSAVSRREVDGIRVPDHMIMKDADGRILEQYWFRAIEINPPMTPGDFKR